MCREVSGTCWCAAVGESLLEVGKRKCGSQFVTNGCEQGVEAYPGPLSPLLQTRGYSLIPRCSQPVPWVQLVGGCESSKAPLTPNFPKGATAPSPPATSSTKEEEDRNTKRTGQMFVRGDQELLHQLEPRVPGPHSPFPAYLPPGFAMATTHPTPASAHISLWASALLLGKNGNV